MASLLLPRQDNNVNNNNNVDPDDDCGYWFDCSMTAIIVKWVIVGGILLFLVLYIVIGSIHARRRMAKGRPPLLYHRWLVSRSQRERFFPPPQLQGTWYQMNPYGAPGGGHNGPGGPGGQPGGYYGYQGAAPPAYNHEENYVPPYPGKTNPDQSYTPPPGPPPQQSQQQSPRDVEHTAGDRSSLGLARGDIERQETAASSPHMYSPSSSRLPTTTPPAEQTGFAK